MVLFPVVKTLLSIDGGYLHSHWNQLFFEALHQGDFGGRAHGREEVIGRGDQVLVRLAFFQLRGVFS